jgi:BirA family biotin operon repressor/biotin-[acetyl-CoA-carboxylase] ligase
MDNKALEYTITHLRSTDSTNNYLKDLLKKRGVVEGTVILADEQTAGKGQGSNSWHGEPGLNIAISILLRPLIKADFHFCLCELASMAIVDMLGDFKIISCIKWPNDVYVNDKKIAGILIENILESDIINYSILGIGLNVNETNFPMNLPNPVSMKSILKKNIVREHVMKSLLKKIGSRYFQIISKDFDNLHNDYNCKLYRKGLRSNYKAKDQIFTATLIEVNLTGELILRTEKNEITNYLFGDVNMVI